MHYLQRTRQAHILVSNRVVEVWGVVDSEDERAAIIGAARRIPNIEEIRDNLICLGIVVDAHFCAPLVSIRQ